MNISAKTVPIFIVFFLLASFSAYAVAITPGLVTMDFVPNAQVTLTFDVARSELINVSLLGGDLAGYMKLIDPNPDSGAREVTVIVTLPDNAGKFPHPGKNRGYVAAKEINSNPNEVSALAEIRAPIVVNVPYPGYYAVMALVASNINEGEPENFQIVVTNLGTNKLENVYGAIDVYEGNTKIKSLTTNTKQIDPNTHEELDTVMSTVGIKPGIFKAVATVYYDGGNTLTQNASFNIGTLYVQVNNYTQELDQGGIKKFDMDIESRWNTAIDNVYATLTFEGADVQTASYSLAPWEKKTLTGYIDTTNQPYGDHDIKMVVHYAGLTTIEDGKVKLVPPAPAKAPEQEKPSGLKLTMTNILIAVIVLLVMIDLAWLVLKNRRAEPAKRRKR